MEIILTQDVANLGEMGAIVNVAPGYGRNYLIPQGMALPANTANKKDLDHKRSVIEKRKQAEQAAARGIQAKLEGTSISVAKRVSDGDNLYGSVSTREIVDALNQQGFQLERRQVQLDQGISELGIYKVAVKLASGIFAHVRVWVVAM